MHPIIWGRVFLPHHLPAESPRFHWILADEIFGPAEKAAFAAPRGFAKTTVADLVCLLYGAAEEKFKYGLLVSDSGDQAELMLAEIRRECETNEKLLTMYPGLRPGRPWSESDICFTNGIRIQAVGWGKKLRGRKHKGSRPDFCLVDDVENDEIVASFERRLKQRKWFRTALLPALSPKGRIRVIGTILHSDSLLSRLLRNSGWVRRLWRALSDDDISLWEAWQPAKKLLEAKEDARRDGQLAAWYQEYQNQALASEERAFRPEDFRYFDRLPAGKKFFKTLYVDVALGEKQKHDWTAFTVVYASDDGFWYVVDAFRRKIDPAETIRAIRSLVAKHTIDSVGIESVAYQRSLAFWLQETTGENDTDISVEEVVPDGDKRRRILALQPFYRAGRIQHLESLGPRLEYELQNLDSTDHDDVADSLAGHLFITLRPEPIAKQRPTFNNVKEERAWKHRKKVIRFLKETSGR